MNLGLPVQFALLFHELLETGALFRGKHFEEFLARALNLVSHNRVQQLVRSLLAFLDDLVNLAALLRCKVQLALSAAQELQAHGPWAAACIGRCWGRTFFCGDRRIIS